MRPLVSRWEYAFHEAGAAALWLAILLRLFHSFRLSFDWLRDSWLLDSQLLAACLIFVLLNLTGCLLPRATGTGASYLLGGVAWAAALSMLPRFLWPTGQLQAPVLWTVGGLALFSLILRFVLRRTWLAGLQGHGFKWMLDWAGERPLYARLVARNALKSIGYRE
ncbi:hypothetical protein IIA79_02430 [bacterium]|nr:hypothetical protein [bacterium]